MLAQAGDPVLRGGEQPRRLQRRAPAAPGVAELPHQRVSLQPGGRVLLGCRRTGDKVRIEVWDNGPGIPLDKQEAIFDEVLPASITPAPPGSRAWPRARHRPAASPRCLGHQLSPAQLAGAGSVLPSP